MATKKYVAQASIEAIRDWLPSKYVTRNIFNEVEEDIAIINDKIDANLGDTNVIEAIKVNNALVGVGDDKSVNITVPTKLSDLENDLGDGESLEDTIDNKIADALADIAGISFNVVASLPATGEEGVIYFLSNSGSGTNTYDEYVWVNNKFEKLGQKEISLDGYVKEEDLGEYTFDETMAILEA